MIENKLSFINGLNDKTFTSVKDEGDTKFYRCPKCGSYHVVKNGTYRRKTPINKYYSTITVIQKYICNECKTSFKYLPIYLTSHSHISTISLLKVLINKSSFNHLSKIYELSRSTIKSIKSRFEITLKKIELLLRKVEVHSLKGLFKEYYKQFDEFLFSSSTTSANYSYFINQLS